MEIREFISDWPRNSVPAVTGANVEAASIRGSRSSAAALAGGLPLAARRAGAAVQHAALHQRRRLLRAATRRRRPPPAGSRTSKCVYHLSSFVHRHRLVVKVMLPRWKDDVEGRLPEVPSVSHVWSTADWHEREVFDLSGVLFTGPRRPAAHPLARGLGRPSAAQGLPAARRISRDSAEIVPWPLERVDPESGRIRPAQRRDAGEHGPAASQHARRVAAGVADRRRGGRRGDAAHRLPAPLRRRRSARTSRPGSTSPTPTAWITWPR